MKTHNIILMKRARSILSDTWSSVVGVTALYFAILISVSLIINSFAKGEEQGIVTQIINQIAYDIIAIPLGLGFSIFFLAISRNKKPTLETLFYGFNKTAEVIWLYIVIVFFILLWSLLLIIPGIIAAIAYSQSYWILADEHNTLRGVAILDYSKKLMDGNKWKWVCLSFRFLGWSILCILTLGIGFLWLLPYMQTTFAQFYDDIKNEYENRESSDFLEVPSAQSVTGSVDNNSKP